VPRWIRTLVSLDSSGSAADSPMAARDFSLALGGPLYQLLRRARLSDDALSMLKGRILVISLVAWLPLLLLSAWAGRLLGGDITVPFLKDVDVHVKLLVVVPLLIVAELVVHRRLRPLIGQFIEQDLVPGTARGRFDAALASAVRLRNSVAAELLMIAVVYGFGIMVVWRHYTSLAASTWYAIPSAQGLEPSPAGIWYGFVSLPIFQFLLVRWLYRLFIWARFMWQVSRLDLQLLPTHPDRAGGLGFLANVLPAYYPLAAAFGAMLAGVLADRIFYSGARLLDFKAQIGAAIGSFVVVFVGPLLVFAPRIAQARGAGLLEYGALAQRYERAFDARWLRGERGAPAGDGDIQSIAGMGEKFQTIRSMSMTPVGVQDIIRLAMAIAVPIVPLVLTEMPLEDLLKLIFGLLR